MHRHLRRSRLIRAATLLTAGAVLPLTSLAAQPQTPPPPPQEDEVVVTGVRNPKEVIEDYVGGLTDIVDDQPIARYAEEEYCPAVLGLSAERNAQIAARMRTVAAAAGVEPAKAGCLPSALVIFVDDAETFLAEFRTRHPIYFTDPQGRLGEPVKANGPVAAWSLVQLVDPQGMPVGSGIGGDPKYVESPAGGSRLLSMVRPVVAMSVVIVERSALVGLTPTQIADYALMRTLTDRGPESLKTSQGVSILGALGAPMGSAVPASLTEWDLAYLKGRYAGHPARYGRSQGAAIRNRMRRALEQASTN